MAFTRIGASSTASDRVRVSAAPLVIATASVPGRPRAPSCRSASRSFGSSPVVFDQLQQPVVLGAARGARRQVRGDAWESGVGVLFAELALDVALEQSAGDPASGVAVIDLEDRFEEAATVR
jgi:hypothetical protein